MLMMLLSNQGACFPTFATCLDQMSSLLGGVRRGWGGGRGRRRGARRTASPLRLPSPSALLEQPPPTT
uniref:Uncharacterized protein n=1 Tax=Aegilops tauschii subsp. strangulata TaxID=200361 RepID=A0A452XMA8_AEGTS